MAEYFAQNTFKPSEIFGFKINSRSKNGLFVMVTSAFPTLISNVPVTPLPVKITIDFAGLPKSMITLYPAMRKFSYFFSPVPLI